MKLWKKVVIGLVLGALFGVFLKDYVVYFKPMGDVFIKMIKMVIIPLIFFAITTGITNVSDSRVLGRIGLKASCAYLLTTTFAVFIGFLTAWALKPGEGMNLRFEGSSLPKVPDGATFQKVMTTLMNVIPDNAIGAMAEGSTLQVVFFAIFTGVTLHHLPHEQKERVASIFQLMSAVVFKMVHLIVELAPYAAFGLIAWVVGTQGLSVVFNLSKLILGMLVACAIQYALFGVMISVFARVSPWPFYKKSFEYQALAFSMSSTKAALTTTMRIAQDRLGISKSSSSFVLPLGASINMDGMAIYLGLCAIFFAQGMGKELSFGDYGILMLTSTLGSIGGAGIPGGSIVMLPMILTSIGLPIEGVALIAGIDRILDMIRTTINITGDVAVTLCVDSSEKTFDKKVYYQSQAPLTHF